jgi:hypothetical protein
MSEEEWDRVFDTNVGMFLVSRGGSLYDWRKPGWQDNQYYFDRLQSARASAHPIVFFKSSDLVLQKC